MYPKSISPLYGLASNGATAFTAINRPESLAAVPVYLLARRVVSHNWSPLAGALSVAGPWLSFTALVMTESVFYPPYLLFALVLVRSLERPTAQRQLVNLGILIGTRWQAIVLAPAIVTAVASMAASSGRVAATLRSFWPTWIAFGGTAIAGVAVRIAGGSPLGAYGALAHGYNPFALARWAAWNVANLELAMGLVAVAAFPLALVRLLRRGAREPEHAVGSVAVALTVWTLASVATLSASPFGLGRVHERGLFYVAPLLIVCFVYWLAVGLPRPRRPTWVCRRGRGRAAAALAPGEIHPRSPDAGCPGNTALGGTRAPAAVRPDPRTARTARRSRGSLLRRRPLSRRGGRVDAPRVLIGHEHPRGKGFAASSAARLAWVDNVLPHGGTATVIYVDPSVGACAKDVRATSGPILVTFTEFFNSTVDRVAHLGGQIVVDALASDPLTMTAAGVVLDHGQPISPRNVVVDSRVHVDGRRLAALDPSASTGSLSLRAARQPLRFIGFDSAAQSCPRRS